MDPELELDRALGAVGLAAFVAGSVAYAAAWHGHWAAPLLMLPWAFVMSGLLAVVLLGPHLDRAAAPWLRGVSVALPGAAVGFVASETAGHWLALAPRLAAAEGLTHGHALVAMHAALTVMALAVAAVWWRERESGDARVLAASLAVGLFALGLAAPTGLLPGLTAIGLQVAAVAGLWSERGASDVELSLEPLEG